MRLCLLLPILAVGLTAEPLTLDQALKEAIDKNLNLIAERFNISIADARILQAGLRPNPVLAYGQDYQNAFGTGVTNDNNAGPSEWNVRVDFPIERGKKRERRIDLAKEQKSVAELQLLNTIRQLLLDVDNAFVDAQAARDSLALAQENLKSLQDVVEVNTSRVRAGDLSEVELRRSRLAAMQFENSVKQAELKVRSTVTRLLLLIGRPPAPEKTEIAGPLREEKLPFSANEVRELAIQRRPDLLAVQRDQARSQADLRLQVATGKVDLDFGAMYHHQYGYANGNTMGFFLSAQLPVWNRNQGEIERARREGTQLTARVRALEAQIENEVQAAYDQYLTSRGLVDRIGTEMLSQARDVRNITEYSYRRGEASFLEFLDAQRAYNDTVQSYNDARADYARTMFLIDAVSAKGVTP
jgi:cobalt-zinc-cadmium efflux system outer membrane protein